MSRHEKLDYVEFPSDKLSASKAFFETVFGWTFTDYGEEYTAFDYQGLCGGFYQAIAGEIIPKGGALLVFYSDNLSTTQTKILAAGGHIAKPVFSFPGGSRFHFLEPGGNEFAVWTETQ